MADYNEELVAVGKVVANAQVLELMLGRVLAEVIGTGFTKAQVLASHLGAGGTVKVLRALLDVQDVIDGETLRAWLNRVDKGLEARNAVVHRPWGAAVEEGPLSFRLNMKKGVTERIDAADVGVVVGLLLQLAEDARSLVPPET